MFNSAAKKKFQQALTNFHCETMKCRTAFYFCNSRNNHSGDKNKSFIVKHPSVKLVSLGLVMLRCINHSETGKTTFWDQFQCSWISFSLLCYTLQRLLKLIPQHCCTQISAKGFNVWQRLNTIMPSWCFSEYHILIFLLHIVLICA